MTQVETTIEILKQFLVDGVIYSGDLRELAEQIVLEIGDKNYV